MMVKSNAGLPDPENSDEELPSTNGVGTGVILFNDDEESDDQETIIIDEYQPLSMDESAESNEVDSEDESEDDNENGASGISRPVIPIISPAEEMLVKEVWSSQAFSSVDIEMDSKKVDEVKQAMVNITLPPSSIPEWAADIPEDEWKQLLLKRISNINRNGH